MQARWLKDALGLFLAYDAEWEKHRMGVSSNLSPGFAEVISTLPERSR